MLVKPGKGAGLKKKNVYLLKESLLWLWMWFGASGGSDVGILETEMTDLHSLLEQLFWRDLLAG